MAWSVALLPASGSRQEKNTRAVVNAERTRSVLEGLEEQLS